MADDSVGVINQSSATVAKVDTSALTRADGSLVERQRIILGDPDDPQQASVKVRGEIGRTYLNMDENVLTTLRSIDQSLKNIYSLLTVITCS